MRMHIQILFLVFTSFLVSANSFFAKGQTNAVDSTDIQRINNAFLEFIQSEELKNASIAFVVIDILSGKPVIQYNENLSIVPASVLKLFTTAAALEILGKDFRFKTELQYQGTIKDSILKGDIFIKGFGDPTLGSRFFKSYYFSPFFFDRWADSVRKAGISGIEGNIIGDGSLFSGEPIPKTWTWGDISNHYGTSPNALTIYDNAYTLYFNSGKSIGDSTVILKTEPEVLLSFENHVTSSKNGGDNAYIFGSNTDTIRRIWGTIPLNKEEFPVKGSLPDPALCTATEFKKHMQNNGIGISGNSQSTYQSDTATLSKKKQVAIAKFYSPALKEIVYQTNKNSINLFAENMLLQIGLKAKNSATAESGSEVVEVFLKKKGIDTDGFYMNDGSGLSRANAVTALQTARLLAEMTKSSVSKEFIASLPIGGTDGTIKGMFKSTPQKGNILAKSGSFTRVRSYAGYANLQNDGPVAFAIIVNNYNCSSGQSRILLEKLMNSLAKDSKK